MSTNTIKLNLIDFEVVQELRKVDTKLVMFGVIIAILCYDDVVNIKKIKRIEKDLEELKGASKED